MKQTRRVPRRPAAPAVRAIFIKSRLAAYCQRSTDLKSRATTELATALLVLSALCVGCTADGDASVSRRIAAEVARGDGVSLDMQQVIREEWDRLHVYAPYTMPAKVERDLGFSWPTARAVRIKERDDITLLVFVRDGQVVTYVAHPRHLGDFSGAGRSGGYSKEEAVFEVHVEGEWPRVVPRAVEQANEADTTQVS
jgi:hypothetical protein